MKKILMFFAIAIMASQALAQTVTQSGDKCQINGKQMFCEIGGGCYEYTTTYSGVGDNDATCGPKNSSNPTCTCQQLFEGCTDFGKAYTDVPASVVGPPGYGSGQTCSAGTLVGGATKCGTCKYSGDETCYAVWSGGSESKGATCDIAMASCATDGGTSGCSETTTQPPPGGGGTCNNGATNYPACNNNTGGGSCTNGATNFPACNNNSGSPIITTYKGAAAGNALAAMHNAVSLQVTKAGTFSIYDMKGNTLRVQRIEQGSHVVQLQLPRGLYIIKATSGSWQQTVKATVK